MSSHAMSLKTVSICRTLFYLSVVCVKTFSHLSSDPMCNWVASAEKSRCPAVSLLPSGLKPLYKRFPFFQPFPAETGQTALLLLSLPWCIPEVPWERRGDLPAPGDAAPSGATALCLQWNGQGEKQRNNCTDPPVSAFCFVSLQSLMALFQK